jgi:hypothetical protein
MRPTHKQNVMILVCSVHEIEPKVGFHKAPPLGQSVGQKSSKVPKGTMAGYDHPTTNNNKNNNKLIYIAPLLKLIVSGALQGLTH